MPNVVDCAAVFDPVKILQDHMAQSTQSPQVTSPSPDTGHSVSSNSDSNVDWIPLKYSGRSYLFLLAPSTNIAQTTSQDAIEASNDLRIIMKVGDTLRFRTTSIALQRDNQCFVKQMDVASGELCITPPTLQQRVSASTAIDPAVTDLTQVKPTPLLDNCWEFTAIQTGLASVNMKFQIYDSKATLRGSFACALWYMVQP